MNRRMLALLLAALVVLAVLAGLALQGARVGGRDRELLLPGLKDQLNDIQRIVVTGPGNKVLATINRGKDNWTVAERGNYPADVGRIRKNLLALADARIVEEKTSTPEFYERLGVQDIASEKAGGIQLTLAGGKQPFSVIIGRGQPGATSLTYVRRAGEPASWLVTGQFDAGKSSKEWLDRTLTDIPAERIQSVAISHPGLGTLGIARKPKDAKAAPANGTVSFEVEGVPAGRELSYPGVANGVAGALADLQMEDAEPRDVLGGDPGKPVVASFVTTDGLTVEARSWRLPAGTRVSFVASGEGAAGKEAALLNARLRDWVYTLPDFRTEQLTRRLEDLLAPAAK